MSEKISLAEKSTLLSIEIKIAETLSNIFENIFNKLGIIRDDAKVNDESVLSTNPVNIAIQKIDNQLSDKLVRDNIALSEMFQFESVSLDDILKGITNLSSTKIDAVKNILTRSRNKVVDSCSPIITQILSNEIINEKWFSSNLKLDPVFKKIKRFKVILRKKYRPVSLLPTVLEVNFIP